jgi:hypothetical protein
LRNELLNGELFYMLHEAWVIVEDWRHRYNPQRPDRAPGYRAPAMETGMCVPISLSA